MAVRQLVPKLYFQSQFWMSKINQGDHSLLLKIPKTAFRYEKCMVEVTAIFSSVFGIFSNSVVSSDIKKPLTLILA